MVNKRFMQIASWPAPFYPVAGERTPARELSYGGSRLDYRRTALADAARRRSRFDVHQYRRGGFDY